jgi:hypothetical protein
MMNTNRMHAIGLVLLLALSLQPVSGQGRTYPNARSGGNYMHNYYFAQAPASTPWAPAWAPDGKSLAVAMSGSIWRVDPASGAADELTADAAYH